MISLLLAKHRLVDECVRKSFPLRIAVDLFPIAANLSKDFEILFQVLMKLCRELLRRQRFDMSASNKTLHTFHVVLFEHFEDLANVFLADEDGAAAQRHQESVHKFG